MGWIWAEKGYLALSLGVVWVSTRFRLPQLCLSGLKRYHVPETGASNPVLKAVAPASDAALSHKELRSRRRHRERSGAASSSDGAIENVVQISLPASVVEASPFFSSFENLVLIGLVVLAAFLFGELYKWGFGWQRGRSPTVLEGALLLASFYFLAKVELFAAATPTNERWYTAGIGVVTSGLALTLLKAMPWWLFDFGVPDAAKAFGPAITAFMRAHPARFGGASDFSLEPATLEVILALFAGTAAALLFTPAMRTTRSVWLASHAPKWSGSLIGAPPSTQLLLHDNLLLPMVYVILQVRPLVEQTWKLAPGTAALMRCAVLLAAGMLQAGHLRVYVQAYLSSALVRWAELKDRQRSATVAWPAEEEKRAADLVRLQVDVNNYLLCKIAVQCLAPGLMFLALGLASLSPALDRRYLSDPQPAPPPTELHIPQVFWDCLLGFAAWWTCAAWFAWTAMTLALFKTGSIRS